MLKKQQKQTLSTTLPRLSQTGEGFFLRIDLVDRPQYASPWAHSAYLLEPIRAHSGPFEPIRTPYHDTELHERVGSPE